MKRLLSAALSLLLALSLLPAPALAAEADPEPVAAVEEAVPVTPESFTVEFRLDGRLIRSKVLPADARSWKSVSVPISAKAWTYGDLTVKAAQLLYPEPLTEMTWYEKNPVVTFEASSYRTRTITIRFMNEFGHFSAETGTLKLNGSPLRLTEEACAPFLPEGYEFVRCAPVAYGINTGTVIVRIRAIRPDAVILRYMDPENPGQVLQEVRLDSDSPTHQILDIQGGEDFKWSLPLFNGQKLLPGSTFTLENAVTMGTGQWTEKTEILVLEGVNYTPEIQEARVRFLDHLGREIKTLTLLPGKSLTMPTELYGSSLVDSWSRGAGRISYSAGSTVDFAQLTSDAQRNIKYPVIDLQAQVKFPQEFTVVFQSSDGAEVARSTLAVGKYADAPADCRGDTDILWVCTQTDLDLTLEPGSSLSYHNLCQPGYLWPADQSTVTFAAQPAVIY